MWGCLLLFIIYFSTVASVGALLMTVGIIDESGNGFVSIIVLIVSWFISMFIMKMIYILFSPPHMHDSIKKGNMF